MNRQIRSSCLLRFLQRRRFNDGPGHFAQDKKNDGGRLERRYQLVIRFQPAYDTRLNYYSLTII